MHLRVNPVTPGAHGPTLDMASRKAKDAALVAWLDQVHPGHADPLAGW